jgi:hypothetical protein
MKKIKQLLLAMATLSFLALGTLACSDDDSSSRRSGGGGGGGSQNASIEGNWYAQTMSYKFYTNGQLMEEDTEVYENGEYVYFHADNTLEFGDNDGVDEEGTYEVTSNSTLIMTFDDEGYEYSEEWSFTATSTTLKMVNEEEFEYDGTTYKYVIEVTATR